MAFGATEAAMKNNDSFENGKNHEKISEKKSQKSENSLFLSKMTSFLPKKNIKNQKWPFTGLDRSK